jgi:hypothetical protein
MSRDLRIDPRCADGTYNFVSSEGWFMPCCYVHLLVRRLLPDPRHATVAERWFLDNLDLFDLNRRGIAEILADPRWTELQRSWEDGTACRTCFVHCGVPVEAPRGTAGEQHNADRLVEVLPDEPGEVGHR